MKTAYLIIGAVAIAACVASGTSLSRVMSAEQPPANSPSLWEYKVVDLQLQAQSETGKPLVSLEDIGSIDRVQKRIEGLLNKQGCDGWELVSYSGGTAVYKRGVDQ